MKNLFRTTLLSILLFLILVFLGIKYHWVKLLSDRGTHQNISLAIPENTNTPIVNNQTFKEEQQQKEEFQAKLLNAGKNNSQLDSMTKDQIILICKQLANKIKTDSLQQELFVGDCVVSNYKEPMQDSEIIEIVPDDIKQLCLQQSKANGSHLPPLERELLKGICVANEINQ